ncbi:helix-turn-helix transcriptional regulator [Aeromonas sp. QDB11]|uniref:helix-turn-helix transcriptional regulator n=1 Tax=Aeromonas sp. QDB11 TaxID=2990482 RepID=UPI0022E69ECE|nr:WYL domain-containing protein [Aeromonas sp. QDB11]
MEKKNKKNDLLVERINEIFTVLYQGSEISKGWLSERFHITERTAYRDLARLANILDEVSPGKYRLSKERQPRLNACELTQFASFTDVAHLFPGSDSQLLRDYMTNERSITINGHTSRDNIKLSDILKQLCIAINKQNKIIFQYKEKIRQAAPYKLINKSGLWYLAAEDNSLKSFEVGRIKSLTLSDEIFPRNPYILDELKHNSGIYFGKKPPLH